MNSNNKYTLSQLDNAGFQYNVQHLRTYRLNGRIMTGLDSLHNIRAKHGEIHNIGGMTVISMVSPDGRIMTGITQCRSDENFCKKQGIHYAIEKALRSNVVVS